jgi:LmbE family N-acetylglucosaminyl deacetylase
MIGLQLPADLRDPVVLCLGAHCDDIEIGCAGALMTLSERHPLLKMHWVVFTAEGQREAETRAAAQRLARRPDQITVEVHALRPSWLPTRWGEAKEVMESVRRRWQPHMIFTHRLEDRHQDHRTIAELTWNSFRDHLVLEYEISKYEGDLGQPNLYVPLSRRVAEAKVNMLMQCFPSQHGHDWFDADTFNGLMRLRGLECRAPERYAEAFHARKLIL